MRLSALYTFIIVSLIACGPEIIHEEKHTIESPWTYDEEIIFNYNVLDTTVAYDLILAVQHERDFGFENLYVQAETTFPDKTVISHPVSLQLADSQGLWLGKCGNHFCWTDIYISPKSYFRSAGSYTLKLRQHSRQDSLTGILGLELRIQKAEEN